MESLQQEALTDITAKRYIDAVRARLIDLEAADDMDQCRIVVRIAGENNLLSDYLLWISLPTNTYVDAPAAITELKRLAITRDTLFSLQDWIKDTEELIAWH